MGYAAVSEILDLSFSFKLIKCETNTQKAKLIEEMYPFVFSILIFKPSRFYLFTKVGLRQNSRCRKAI